MGGSSMIGERESRIGQRIRPGFLALGFVLLVLGAAPTGTAAEREALFTQAKVTKFGSPLEVPDIRLRNLKGDWVDIREFRGKVILLNLWATWCSFCRKERPALEKVYQAYRDKGFAVVAVSIDKEGARIVRPFVERRKLTFPQLLDPDMRVSSGIFGLWGTPTNYRIDRRWRIVGGAVGYLDWSGPAARKLIEHLLTEEASVDGSSK